MIIDVAGETPRIGVFVCACGINISSVIDIDALAAYSLTLPGVVHSETNAFSCSQDTQVHLSTVIREKRLNRVVVAACTPRTHEPLFRETLEAAGLNKYLFAMANIRNHGAWVHAGEPEAATRKAKDQVRQAVAGVRLQYPLADVTLGITPSALVVGGGVAGMTAALETARQGFEVHLVEQGATLGGSARSLRIALGGPVAPYLEGLEAALRAHPRVHLRLQSSVAAVDGFVGNFKTTIQSGAETVVIEHGAVIVATGANGLDPTGLYGYGSDPRIMTHPQIDTALVDGSLDPKALDTAVFIQCVGSREPDRPACSRVCCTHTVETAIHLKETNPGLRVIVLYRDMRTYGKRETLYQKARALGVIFSRFRRDRRPQVSVADGELCVTFKDHVLQRWLTVKTDLLGLASAIIPADNSPLAQMLKAPLTTEGWYAEAHAKLRPVDSVTEGVYLAGLSHFPKTLEESVTQARAAVAQACGLLSRATLTLPGTVAAINPAKCVGCGVCWVACPFGAIAPDQGGKAVVNEALCKGCGVCTASCRSAAPELRGFSHADIMAQVAAILG